MPVINQTLENRLRRTFDMINSTQAMKPYRKQYQSQQFVINKSLYIGQNKAILRYLKTIPIEQISSIIQLERSHHESSTDDELKLKRIRLTKQAFSKLEPTDMVAYTRSYHIGFPVGIGALKYYQASTDPSTVNIDPSGLLDLPDGAEKKLYQIINQKDPFRFTFNEWFCKLGHLL